MRAPQRGFLLLILAVFVFFGLIAVGAERPESPDVWNGLMLDESSVQDAVDTLGEPRKDKQDQKLTTQISRWIDPDARFRKLEYKKVADVDKANLYFLNGRLKVIELDLKETFVAVKLPLYYDLRYYFLDDSGILTRDPFDYGVRGYRQGDFPTTFHLIGIGDTAFLVALIVHQGVSRMLYEQTGVRTDVPGSVQVIQLISRQLQTSEVPD